MISETIFLQTCTLHSIFTCSQKQLDMLLNELDADGSGTIEYESVFICFTSRVLSIYTLGWFPEYKYILSLFIFESELMGGSAMVKKEREKMDRQAADAQMYARDSSLTISKSSIQSPKPQTQSQTSSRPWLYSQKRNSKTAYQHCVATHLIL